METARANPWIHAACLGNLPALAELSDDETRCNHRTIVVPYPIMRTSGLSDPDFRQKSTSSRRRLWTRTPTTYHLYHTGVSVNISSMRTLVGGLYCTLAVLPSMPAADRPSATLQDSRRPRRRSSSTATVIFHFPAHRVSKAGETGRAIAVGPAEFSSLSLSWALGASL